MRLSEEGKARQNNEWARETWLYMHQETCEHQKRAGKQSVRYFTVDELADEVGYPRWKWPDVRERILQIGYPLGLEVAPYGGYYVGQRGDQMTIHQHRYRCAAGLAARQRAEVIAVCQKALTPGEIGEWLTTKGHTAESFVALMEAYELELPEEILAGILAGGA